MTRAEAFELFKGCAREVWRNKDPDFYLCALALSDDPPKADVLASLHMRGGKPWAMGRSLLRRATSYTLHVADELLEMPLEETRKVMLHEAVHLGYANHGRDFREVAREVGASVTEDGRANGNAIQVQKKEGARYQTVRTFTAEEEHAALAWMRQQARAEKGSRWRLSM